MKDIKLCASVISSNLLNIDKDLKILEEEGFDYLHFDIMDGHFVPRIGLGITLLQQIIESSSIPIEVHLMVDNPDYYIKKISYLGISKILIHYDFRKNIFDIIKKIKRYGKIATGIVLNPDVNLDCIKPIKKDIDLITLMAYSPGTIGQKPRKNINLRIRNLRDMLIENKADIDIGVDGGISLENIDSYRKSGANHFILGNAGLFVKDRELKEQISLIKKVLGGD